MRFTVTGETDCCSSTGVSILLKRANENLTHYGIHANMRNRSLQYSKAFRLKNRTPTNSWSSWLNHSARKSGPLTAETKSRRKSDKSSGGQPQQRKNHKTAELTSTLKCN